MRGFAASAALALTARLCPADSLEKLGELQTQFRAVAARVAPSVVSLSVAENAADADDVLRPGSMNGEKLESILSRTTRTVGSAFVIDAAGYLLTNEHVIADAGQIWACTDSHEIYPAIVVGSDPRRDLAVLKIDAGNLTPVEFAEPAPQRGSWTIAIGNPYGLAEQGEMSVSVGVVSALNRTLARLNRSENRFYSGLLQTTAEINPGNSGGPLLDLQGRVIAINTAVILPQAHTNANGIGFAMPITPELRAKVQDLKQGRQTCYGYLGVNVSTPTPALCLTLGERRPCGVLIDKIEPGSPADGLLVAGDLVLNFNNVPVDQSEGFIRLVSGTAIDRQVRLLINRNGTLQELFVMLRRRSLPSVAVDRSNQQICWRGATLRAASSDGNGILVADIDKHSLLYNQGVRRGGRIISIGGQIVRSVIDAQVQISRASDPSSSIGYLPPGHPFPAPVDATQTILCSGY